MKERRTTLPPKLTRIASDITEAITEARKIKELTVQEEVLVELDKVDGALGHAKKRNFENNETLGIHSRLSANGNQSPIRG